jgi:hypothetical protein
MVETRIATYHLQGKETMWWDNLSKKNILMRGRSHGGSSKDISKRNVFQSITMKER